MRSNISDIGAAAGGVLMLATVFTGCADTADAPASDEVSLTAQSLTLPAFLRTSWLSFGNGNGNTREQPREVLLSPLTVPRLELKWRTDLGGDISSTPVVDGSAVYVTDMSGRLSRLKRDTGEVVWSHTAAEYSQIPGNTLRATPVIAGDLLVVGDQGGQVGAGAHVFAVDKNTGELVWATGVEAHPAAVITQSASIHDGKVYVGVSSIEEFYAVSVPGYQCCSFRGSLLSLDLATGAILWKTPMIDDAAYIKGYRGNAIWGSQPTIDAKRGSVYIATGNNYDIPPSVGECVQRVLDTDPTNEAATRACLADDKNYFDALVALDLADGHVKWANPVLSFDAFTIACVFLPEVFGDNCPAPAGPDHDFGQAPMMFRVGHGRNARDLVGAAQKSGSFWALDPDSGALVWTTKVGPGGHIGGAMWGSATDGKRLYVTNANSELVPWKLEGRGRYAGQTVTRGFWSALDPETGKILWQTPDPNVTPAPPSSGLPFGGVMAPVTVANGVLYGASLAPAPDAKTMLALDAASGAVLWGFAPGVSVISGPSVADGVVYWGSGYLGGGLNLGTPGKTVFAFTLPALNRR